MSSGTNFNPSSSIPPDSHQSRDLPKTSRSKSTSPTEHPAQPYSAYEGLQGEALVKAMQGKFGAFYDDLQTKAINAQPLTGRAKIFNKIGRFFAKIGRAVKRPFEEYQKGETVPEEKRWIKRELLLAEEGLTFLKTQISDPYLAPQSKAVLQAKIDGLREEIQKQRVQIKKDEKNFLRQLNESDLDLEYITPSEPAKQEPASHYDPLPPLDDSFDDSTISTELIDYPVEEIHIPPMTTEQKPLAETISAARKKFDEKANLPILELDGKCGSFLRMFEKHKVHGNLEEAKSAYTKAFDAYDSKVILQAKDEIQLINQFCASAGQRIAELEKQGQLPSDELKKEIASMRSQAEYLEKRIEFIEGFFSPGIIRNQLGEGAKAEQVFGKVYDAFFEVARAVRNEYAQNKAVDPQRLESLNQAYNDAYQVLSYWQSRVGIAREQFALLEDQEKPSQAHSLQDAERKLQAAEKKLQAAYEFVVAVNPKEAPSAADEQSLLQLARDTKSALEKKYPKINEWAEANQRPDITPEEEKAVRLYVNCLAVIDSSR